MKAIHSEIILENATYDFFFALNLCTKEFPQLIL